jgi:2-oxoglutarate dehydrogenase E2 component (dihydrolipoamide succinyltransferase)
MGLAEVESAIVGFSTRGEEGKLGIQEITGGTFTISNGGIFGSMLSTPILNPPQSAILGLHRIQPRPVAEGDKVVVRPMMYLALSYDHRIIDGREAVLFLVAVKELIEDPTRFILRV